MPARPATSRHIPGVRFAGLTHPGLIGCAPSHDLLAKWNKREAELVETNPSRVPPLANLTVTILHQFPRLQELLNESQPFVQEVRALHDGHGASWWMYVVVYAFLPASEGAAVYADR